MFKGSAQGSLIWPVSYNIFANDVLSILDDDIKNIIMQMITHYYVLVIIMKILSLSLLRM